MTYADIAVLASEVDQRISFAIGGLAPAHPARAPGRPGRLRWRTRALLTSPTAAAVSRGDGRHLRPDPPRPPGRRVRGAGVVRPRRGRVRAHRGPVAEDRPGGHPGRAPLPDDGDRDGVEPAVQRLPGRHRPGRPDVHRGHAQGPAGARCRTPSSTSSPARTRWPTSSRGARPTTCSGSPTSSSAAPGPATRWTRRRWRRSRPTR